MPIRNPFAKRPFLTTGTDVAGVSNNENVRPGMQVTRDSYGGFERVDTVGSKTSSAWSIHSSKSRDTGDYKMSGKPPAMAHPASGFVSETSNQHS